MIKLKPNLICILLLSSCIYDPQPKGKDVIIHNQTNKPFIVSNALTEADLRLYDTALVNNRRYISMQPNYINKYGVCSKFYSDNETDDLKNTGNDKLSFYIIDPTSLQNTSDSTSMESLSRSISISVDSLKKYDLNHLFILDDTVLFEHKYSWN